MYFFSLLAYIWQCKEKAWWKSIFNVSYNIQVVIIWKDDELGFWSGWSNSTTSINFKFDFFVFSSNISWSFCADLFILNPPSHKSWGTEVMWNHLLDSHSQEEKHSVELSYTALWMSSICDETLNLSYVTCIVIILYVLSRSLPG